MKNLKNFKFLVIGLGSMGKRRIRNLFANNQRNIVGFDIRPDRSKEAQEKYGIKILDSFDQVNPDDFDAIIISVSPEAHGDYIRFALKNKKHFFVEHPVNTDGYQDIFENNDLNIVKAPSCTPIYYPVIKAAKKIINEGRIGKILAFQHHMGQYLPDWHPWEDYRKVYFSRKETGACREMLPFELIGISYLLGSKVTEISGSIAKVSDLDMDADDIILAVLKYDNNIRGSIIIDVLSRKPIVVLRIIGSKGTLEWNKYESTLKVYDIESGQTENIDIPKGHAELNYVNPEEPYIEEIKTFLQAINSEGEYPHTFETNYQLLKTLHALEESSRTGKRISIE
ncbi:MAG: hypothetical protein A3J62_02055 [Candidatus Buchananbacteria bacterium RIFCSPHIGHO2_02_FULL_38_8]|uniref:Gfo/Idh/MocA-like oxidoreductase N-terminal domain-containing protein n=1 Tax=Candidatus Buchananbacteria bacterium RIFCSPHIGHO2_02_FULL_38_8 TaxID=1797538 RepID=A0A1G1Y3M0_9BACT|nr:MAG: hypothetical protein A3J62_02055 [Candidatus Buchananbacteria bacterium RIFCSPHIGHO2_02_FULL_38_8]